MVVSLAFFAVGGAIFAWAVRELRYALASSSWPVVPGTILSSMVKSEFDQVGSSDGVPPVKMHSGSVRYRYATGGKEYEGQRIEFGPSTASSWKAAAVAGIAPYPVGKVVKVSVSPASPSMSVLVPGANWGVYAGCALGAILSLIGIVLLIRDAF